MLRSIKSQIIVALSVIIIAILGATAYFLIDQKIREVNGDIFNKAVSFAELTHERVINSFEINYKQQAFANFERELSEIYHLNEDIKAVFIYNYEGAQLYPEGLNPLVDLARLQTPIPSVKVRGSGRIVYLDKSTGNLRYTNFNGKEVNPIQAQEQIDDIVFPFRDPNNITRNYSIRFVVSYDLLSGRIQQTVMQIGAIAAAGITAALFIGFILAYGITRPLKKLSLGATQIGRGDLSTRIQIKSKSEIGMLASTFNQMAADLETSTQLKIEHEKTAKELELASKIQQKLLPTQLPDVPGLDIAASVSPATQVGGDCYDFIQMEDGNLLFYVADVTGHGVGAGLVSAINNALIPALLEHFTSTQELIIHLNRLLKIKTSPNVFVTMLMAMWKIQSNQLEFTQAGHDPILHYQAQSKTVVKLAHGGMALAMIPDVSKVIKTKQVETAPGDVFVLYTDGIPEAWKNDDETYGMDHFMQSLQSHGALPTAKEIHQALLDDVHAFMGNYPQQDDITLIVVKRTG